MEQPEYIPSPIDLSDVTLPNELIELQEIMARNVHEVWAKARRDEGWTYGSTRNDARKEHPGLVPYEQLSDSEREYDRSTAISTLKLILKSGFTIIPPK